MANGRLYMKRQFLFTANWKMNKSPRETEKFIEDFFGLIDRRLHKNIILLPSTICLSSVRKALSGSHMKWGAQNSHFEESGPFTGETSPKILAEYGAEYVLVGHSERRKLFSETDKAISKKIHAIQKYFMTPLLCIGETVEERKSGKTQKILLEQLEADLTYLNEGKNLIIAYEPIWAIGTGSTAKPEYISEAHKIIRDYLNTIGGELLAEHTPILYGGSIKPENCSDIAKIENVDGFLVGSASLSPQEFSRIIKNSV